MNRTATEVLGDLDSRNFQLSYSSRFNLSFIADSSPGRGEVGRPRRPLPVPPVSLSPKRSAETTNLLGLYGHDIFSIPTTSSSRQPSLPNANLPTAIATSITANENTNTIATTASVTISNSNTAINPQIVSNAYASPATVPNSTQSGDDDDEETIHPCHQSVPSPMTNHSALSTSNGWPPSSYGSTISEQRQQRVLIPKVVSSHVIQDEIHSPITLPSPIAAVIFDTPPSPLPSPPSPSPSPSPASLPSFLPNPAVPSSSSAYSLPYCYSSADQYALSSYNPLHGLTSASTTWLGTHSSDNLSTGYYGPLNVGRSPFAPSTPDLVSTTNSDVKLSWFRRSVKHARSYTDFRTIRNKAQASRSSLYVL